MAEYVAPRGEFLQKWNEAAPYHMFFSTVPQIPETRMQPLSVMFSEILDTSIGKIVQSLHTTMIVDLEWMWNQYIIAGQQENINITVLHGDERRIPSTLQNIKVYFIKSPYRYGSQHAKISILQYQDSAIRIVVSSSNLFRDDWEFRTQGLWMSPHLPRMDDSAKVTDGESPTGFKRDFLHFLEQYGDQLEIHWKEIVSRADCSAINVAFVASVPSYSNVNDTKWGHQKLGALLHEHMMIPENEPRMSIVVQASSIGALGADYDIWVGNELVRAMTKPGEEEQIPTFKFIFPTIDEYNRSIDRSENSNCLFNAERPEQRWIEGHMQKWKADNLFRTRAMPHIKTLTRLSADNKRISFFVLGSGNLSKAAWGKKLVKKYQILNYEASVMFIPKFVTGEKDFSICDDSTRSFPKFPMPYDLPLTPYSPTDRPFFSDQVN